MLKNFGKLKLEPKVGKNLVLKDEKDTSYADDEEIACISKRIPKALSKLGAISRKGESEKLVMKGKESDTCHKCGKFGHYINACLIHKIEHKDYTKQNDEK